MISLLYLYLGKANGQKSVRVPCHLSGIDVNKPLSAVFLGINTL